MEEISVSPFVPRGIQFYLLLHNIICVFFFLFTCFECLPEPVLLLREWPGLKVLAGDLSRPLITDWLLLRGGGQT